jgi:GMP synthase-like glutamine amidotransferase
LNIHCFQHVPFEGLGTIQPWIESHEHSLSVTRFFENDTLPEIANIDWLIVMGGPMGVYEEQQFPWLIKEKQFIAETIRQKKKVLGICLGAQLIASALGANVYPNTQKEIGWFPVNLTETGMKSVLFKLFPKQFMVFHWHGDTFDMPEEAHCLVESKACKHQAFSYGDHVLGLQFHLEVTQDNINLLIQNCGNELHEAQYIQTAQQLRASEKNFDLIRDYMEKILDQIASSAKTNLRA